MIRIKKDLHSLFFSAKLFVVQLLGKSKGYKTMKKLLLTLLILIPLVGCSLTAKEEVVVVEDIDGYKFFFSDDQWVMIRPSGTEPVLRTYAEAATTEKAFEILRQVHKVLLED